MGNLVADLASNVFRFLRDQAGLIADFLSPAPSSDDYDEDPFTPPFTGGQCEGAGYTILLRITTPSGGVGYLTQNFNGFGDNGDRLGVKAFGDAQPPLIGAFRGIDAFRDNQGRWVIDLLGQNTLRINLDNGAVERSGIQVDEVFPRGFVDNCGDISDPSPTLPTGESGISSAPFPDIESGEEILVEGVAPLAIPSALAAALAALKLAVDAAAIGNAIANALEELERLNRARNNADKPTPEDEPPADGKPTIVRYTFGFLEGDGYINLYPDVNTKYEGIYLDIIIENIPVGFGKEFGRRSPNRYKFRKLGWVAFVSPSFSLFNFQELEFRRNCLPIPEGAIGFYYNLGLDKVINGGAIGYFNKYLEESS